MGMAQAWRGCDRQFSAKVFETKNIILDSSVAKFCLPTRGLNYKSLQIRNLQYIDKFHSKLVSFILSVTHTSFDKHTCLLWNLYITNP